MPDEALIMQIENLLAEIVELGGDNERSQIVPNLTVQDASPTNLDGWVIVSDDRDGDNILARKLGSVVYSDNDLVNVMFLRGTEPIAFQQGSESSNNGIWEIVPSTSTDIFYDKGDVGIGKSVAPDAALEILDASQAQLRLTHTEDTKHATFTLDTNHDLTIKPTSTGQVIFQPTTDSTDFFQVLDADGGNPVLNVDSTNERVGIGIAAPLDTLDVGGDMTLRGVLSREADNVILRINGGTDELSGAAMIFRGRDRATLPGYAIFNYGGYDNIGAVGFRQINTAGTATGTMTLTAGGDLFVGPSASPAGRLHVYDTISGWLFWEYDGLNATVREIIPNGSGDVLYRLHAAYVLRDSAAAVASGTTDVSNGASVNLTVGTNTVRLRVNADGSTDIARTAGTDTIKVALTLRWL